MLSVSKEVFIYILGTLRPLERDSSVASSLKRLINSSLYY